MIQHHTKCHLVPSECFTWTHIQVSLQQSLKTMRLQLFSTTTRRCDAVRKTWTWKIDLVDLPRLTKLFANILFSASEASAFEDNLFRLFYARWVVLQLFGAGKLDGNQSCWMFVLRKDVSIISNINTHLCIYNTNMRSINIKQFECSIQSYSCDHIMYTSIQ